MKTNLSAIDRTGHPFASVVCLHASGSSSRQWNALGERIGHRARVVALDFYGHGEAPTWNQARALTLRDEASRVMRVLLYELQSMSLRTGPRQLRFHEPSMCVRTP